MTFSRSTNGLGNRFLFTRTDVTVYTESCPNKDLSKYIDDAFWREFFNLFFPELSITFVPLGGKPHVRNMAEKIIGNSICNSFCAMDIDYDNLLDLTIIDDRVFYTFGYGVENDLLFPDNIAGLIRALMPGLPDSQLHADKINSHILTTCVKARLPMYADQIAFCRGFSILDRKKPLSDISVQKTLLPVCLHSSKLLKKITLSNSLKSTPIADMKLSELAYGPQAMPSHHFFEIVYHTVKNYMSKFTILKISKDGFIAICIGLIQNNFDFLSQHFSGHYEQYSKRNLSKYLQ